MQQSVSNLRYTGRDGSHLSEAAPDPKATSGTTVISKTPRNARRGRFPSAMMAGTATGLVEVLAWCDTQPIL